MKVIIAYLLAFSVLILSCIPCQDEVLPDTSTAATALADAGDGHQQTIDLCSPFCICACCASVTISTTIAALPENAVSQWIQPAGFSYLQVLYAGDKAGFWQPPQERV